MNIDFPEFDKHTQKMNVSFPTCWLLIGAVLKRGGFIRIKGQVNTSISYTAKVRSETFHNQTFPKSPVTMDQFSKIHEKISKRNFFFRPFDRNFKFKTNIKNIVFIH